MKILQYNWADYLSSEGGGVTVYLKNIMTSKAFEEHDAYMLSSGVAYTLTGKPFWREVTTPENNGGRRFEIVNAKTSAPASAAFGNPFEFDSPEDVKVFIDFIDKHGPFDIIHFHNIEGLSLGVLRALRKAYPKTKLVLSVHNYFIFCPQVNMWLLKENTRCTDFLHGKRCQECAVYPTFMFRTYRAIAQKAAQYKRLQAISQNREILSLFHKCKNLIKVAFHHALSWRHLLRNTRRSAIEEKQPTQLQTCETHDFHDNYFDMRRKAYVTAVNDFFDRVFCVSERVRQICLNFGLDPSKTFTSYIGTRHADKFSLDKSGPLFPEPGSATLTFLGYAREDKGFFFLLDAIEQLPKEIASEITLQLGVKINGDKKILDLIHKKCQALHEVKLFDGYTHDELDDILAGTSLGLVPVLWEDNLPQVALEMHCHGIPLLCSNLGGAQELANNPNFVFEAGSIEDFTKKLDYILASGFKHEEYWDKTLPPIGVENHSKHLLAEYQDLLQR